MTAPERTGGDRALLRFLARQGRINHDDVTRIEGILEDPTANVHDVLERENIITQKDLALLLAETLRLRIVDLTTYPLDANVTRELKETIATRYEVVPISIDERTIEVVTANPLDLDGLKAVEFATGKRVQAVVATHVEVKDALAHTYRLQESLEQFLQLVPSGESLVVNELSDDGADLRTVAADAELPPVIKLADKMLIEGIKSRASDIHLEPGTDSVLVRYRVDGILEEGFRFPKWIQNPLVARLKVMAKLDITERRMPQDGRIQLRYQDKTVDLRVSSLPAQHGEKITLRILDASQAVKALDRLGFSAGDLKIIRDAAKKPQGMILITGPTGSGKTTTLYALLREILSPKTNIVTIENPIEYQLKGINQVEVNEKQGLTFSEVLRSVLRQDPDVILLGEIRDKETAQIAFQAASTGHLVLSTVHTNDAAGAVTRLLDLGLEPYAAAAALNLVVAQRLVRQLCPNCATPTVIDDETRRRLHVGDAQGTFKKSNGCPQCRHTGYRSRFGVYELLPMTTAMTKLVEAGAGESMVRQQARTEALHTLLEDAVEKLRTGVTSVEEIERVVQITDAGGMRCPGCQKEIAEEYSVCPHCSLTLRSSCSGCAKPLNPEWVSCPFCGSAAVVAPVPEADAAAAPVERRTFKALVVDDTSTIRDVVRHALEHSDLGLTVLTAENGLEALEIAGRERPDIVILDISMPEMDGFEVCRRLRSEMRTAFVPVLMLTAHDSEDDVARGFGVGADDYMVKPFRREGLLARVRRILERTYGSQAVGGGPTTERVSAVVPPPSDLRSLPSMPLTPDAAGLDVGAALAALANDRDVLRRSVEGCEARIAEIAARPATNGHIEMVGGLDAGPDYHELKRLVLELQAAHEQAVRDFREELAHAKALAARALEHAEAPPPIDAQCATTMLETVERLQGDQTRLSAALDDARTASGAADEECERRLRQAAQDLTQMRGGLEELRIAQQRDAQSLRAELRTQVDETLRAAQGETTTTVARVAQTVTELRGEIETQRSEHARDGARVRSAQETAERAESGAAAAVELLNRELAALQRALAEQREQREQDLRRVSGAEEAARRTRTETTTSIEQMAGELGALRRTLGEQLDDGARIGERVAGTEEGIRAARAEASAASEALTAEIGALRRQLAEHREGGVGIGERLGGVEAAARRTAEDAAALTAELRRELAKLGRSIAMGDEDRRILGEQLATVASAQASWTATGATSQQVADEVANLRRAFDERLASVEGAQHASAATAVTGQQVTDEITTLRQTFDERMAMLEAAQLSWTATSATGQQVADEIAALRQVFDERLATLEATQQAWTATSATGQQVSDEITALRQAFDERLATLEATQQAWTATSATGQQVSDEIAALRRTLAEYAEVRAHDAARLASAEEAADAARNAAVRGAQEMEELRATLTAYRETHAGDGSGIEGSAATLDLVRGEARAAAETAARMLRAETVAMNEQTAREMGQLRNILTDQHEAAETRGQESERQIASVREEAGAALGELRHGQSQLSREIDGRLANLPSAAEHRTVLAFLDGCETQLTEFAARLDAQGVAHVAAEDEARAQLGTRVESLEADAKRLDGEQRRLAADVEERLRALMRTAAGGFDVQLALLRGKVEVLARGLRERMPVDPESASDDALMQHRQGLLERLRSQLVALQSGTEWRPQRVLDLLVETTLAAAVTPFRRMLQLASDVTSSQGSEDSPVDAPTVTDESASPSSDP